jgi:cytochrome c biogenesis protein CcdA
MMSALRLRLCGGQIRSNRPRLKWKVRCQMSAEHGDPQHDRPALETDPELLAAARMAAENLAQEGRLEARERALNDRKAAWLALVFTLALVACSLGMPPHSTSGDMPAPWWGRHRLLALAVYYVLLWMALCEARRFTLAMLLGLPLLVIGLLLRDGPHEPWWQMAVLGAFWGLTAAGCIGGLVGTVVSKMRRGLSLWDAGYLPWP